MSVATQKGGIIDLAIILIAGGVGAILTQLDNEVIHWEFIGAGVVCVLLGSFMPIFREWWKPRWHMAEELEKVDVFRDKIIEHMSPDKERPDVVAMESKSELLPGENEFQVEQAVELSKETDKTIDASTLPEEEYLEEWGNDD